MSQPFTEDQLRRIEFQAWQREERQRRIAEGKLRPPSEEQPEREPAQPEEIPQC